MSTILAIDTATQACSAALLQQGVVKQEFSDEPRSHTRLLLPMVDKLLVSSECNLSEVDAIAFTAGPGSFTGLRIGLGVVQGLAFGANIPVIPVSTLEVMALGAVRQLRLEVGTVVVPALDARMGEVYWGAYSVGLDQSVQAIHADKLTSPDKVAESLNENTVGVGDGWQFADSFPVSTKQISLDIVPQAQDAISIAQLRFNSNDVYPIDKVQLTYLRDEVSWKKRVKLRP